MSFIAYKQTAVHLFYKRKQNETRASRFLALEDKSQIYLQDPLCSPERQHVCLQNRTDWQCPHLFSQCCDARQRTKTLSGNCIVSNARCYSHTRTHFSIQYHSKRLLYQYTLTIKISRFYFHIITTRNIYHKCFFNRELFFNYRSVMVRWSFGESHRWNQRRCTVSYGIVRSWQRAQDRAAHCVFSPWS